MVKWIRYSTKAPPFQVGATGCNWVQFVLHPVKNIQNMHIIPVYMAVIYSQYTIYTA